MNLIEASHLSKSFGSTRAVDDLSLYVEAGEIFGLVGPDGAGKTTFMRLLCGALLPDPGHPEAGQDNPLIMVGGYNVLKQTEQARTGLGYLPQRFSLYEELTVLENIRFFAEVRGLAAAEWRPRCMEILKFVGLAEFVDRRAGQLSGGMKQKLGLAAALVHQPQILLLDEPTTGVDPVTRQDFWQLIIRLVGEKIRDDGGEIHREGNLHRDGESHTSPAVLISTPYMDEAARCTRVGFMQHGRLIVEGTPSELRAPLEGQVLELAGQPLAMLRRLAEADEAVQGVQMFGDRLHLRIRPGQSEAVTIRLQEMISAKGGQGFRMRPIAPQLEDVFMSLLEQEA
jgi:ABC-2 type transport system ATP-binding protein